MGTKGLAKRGFVPWPIDTAWKAMLH